MNMVLLQIDYKLMAMQYDPFYMFNITDQLVGHTIQKIIFNDMRYIILTTTNLYYLSVKDDFQLVDITEVTGIPISDIKFISNLDDDDYGYSFAVFTNDIDLYHCTFVDCQHRRTTYISHIKDKIVTVSSRDSGYIYKTNNGNYTVKYINSAKEGHQMYTLTDLPIVFMNTGYILGESNMVGCLNVTHVYNETYCVKNGLIAHVKKSKGLPKYGKPVTNRHKIINTNGNFRIVTTLYNNPKIIKLINTGRNITMQPIGKSYYHVENLHQYDNTKWSTVNHYLYNKPVNRIVNSVLLCHKYGGIKQWIPKGVLLMILSFAL